ncbi:MAG: pyridoxal phosphate-dependent aminotransferase [Clostridia bacterium]|nr:pyridoxal phosphate-dependent aminotransferase [Clostridia bacterium]
MLSNRYIRLGTERSAIRELFEYGVRRKAELGADRVFDFSLGNPSVPCPEIVNEEIKRLASTDPIASHGYTSAPGDPVVRDAIARFITRTQGFPARAEELYLTCGCAAALVATLSAVVSPGEEVIVLAPYFPEYRVFVEGVGATLREVKCKGEDFSPDPEAIKATLNEKTAAIIINSPNNPTGAVYSEEDIRAIAELLNTFCRENGRTVYIISDEPYRELVYDDARVPFIPSYYSDTIVCYSFSKSLSLPGERIGYVFVPHCAREADSVYAAVAGAGRSLGYVCAPSLMQKIIPACLGLTADISVYNQNRLALYDGLTKMGFVACKPKGAFYLFLRAPSGDAVELCERAKKYELLLVPSESFGYPGYARISYCVRPEQIEAAMPAFRKLAEEYGLIKEIEDEQA